MGPRRLSVELGPLFLRGSVVTVGTIGEGGLGTQFERCRRSRDFQGVIASFE